MKKSSLPPLGNATENRPMQQSAGNKDAHLMAKLSDKQKERFNAGSKEEQAKAMEFLKLKHELEKNQVSSSDNPY